MLTREQIYEIADHHGLKVVNRWAPASVGRAAPELLGINVWFPKTPAPEAWQLLMSNETEVPMKINGVRRNDDANLGPEYATLLPAVNALRATRGLAPTCGS